MTAEVEAVTTVLREVDAPQSIAEIAEQAGLRSARVAVVTGVMRAKGELLEAGETLQGARTYWLTERAAEIGVGS